MEGVDAVELGSVDEAEEDISDVGAVFRLVEQGVFAMQNGFFQSAFTQIIVDRCAWYLQESCELVPVLEHVADGLAKT